MDGRTRDHPFSCDAEALLGAIARSFNNSNHASMCMGLFVDRRIKVMASSD